MSSFNRCILIGNLVADVELRYTQSQKAVCNFRIATNEKYKDEEKTEFHQILCWDKQAENCNKYLSKGRSVMVEGRLQTRSWEDKNGKKNFTTEIIAQTVQFLGGGRDEKPEAMVGQPDLDKPMPAADFTEQDLMF